MKTLDSLAPLLPDYDAFIIDLWGVVHDGTALYPGAAAALETLYREGKRVAFLSNAPRQAHKAQAILDKLGIPRGQYERVLTSGQAAHDLIAANLADWGSSYYYLGPSKDEDVLADLPLKKVAPEQADFILNAGFEYDEQPIEEILPLIERLLKLEKRFLCINPDIEVVKQDGSRLLCAGWVAREFEKSGGTVEYIGKPHKLVYDILLGGWSEIDRSRILVIGDALATDIAGATSQSIDSLLVTGGILKEKIGSQSLESVCAEQGIQPTYVMPSLR